MTVIVVGHWELEWSAPLTEADLWALPLRDFGVEDWRMWPVSGIRCREDKVHLTEGDNIDEVLQGVEGVRVFVEPNSPVFPLDSVDLDKYVHPENAVYIFGSAHFNPTVGRIGPGDEAVTLRTLEDRGVLWPHQVLVTLLHDRLVKS